jgi:hypothetical protein
MTDGEQTHIQAYVLQPIQEEDDAQQEAKLVLEILNNKVLTIEKHGFSPYL